MPKDKEFVIYKHTSPSGKVYIGQTCMNVWVRWLHNGKGYMRNPIFWKAIQKYGWDNFTHEILLEGLSKSEANYAEIYLIKWYKLHNMSYNCTAGGDGTLGLTPWNKGLKGWLTPWNKGKHLSEETKTKISQHKRGHKYGPQSEEHIRHKAEKRKVPIVQVDINNPMIWKEWPSAKDVEDCLKFNRKNIGQSVTNRSIHAYGYFWFYADQFGPDTYAEKQQAYKKAKIHYKHDTCPSWINKDGINIIKCLKPYEEV